MGNKLSAEPEQNKVDTRTKFPLETCFSSVEAMRYSGRHLLVLLITVRMPNMRYLDVATTTSTNIEHNALLHLIFDTDLYLRIHP